MGLWNNKKKQYESRVYKSIQILKKQEREKLKNKFKFGDDLGNNNVFISANMKQKDIAYSYYNKETDSILYAFFDNDSLTEIAKESIKK